MKSQKFQYRLNKPHKKALLTTRFGRRIDDASYLKLFLITCFIWGGASIYFFFASAYDQGMKTELSGLDLAFEAMYFSGVTLTTLGYGDVLPIGFGRVVSVLTAMSGLTVIATLIAKISSERQSSILLLIHTSDIERRMSEYTYDIENYIEIINNLLSEKKYKDLGSEIKKLRGLVEIINKYMTFHINQSLFLEIGTESAIKKLLLKLSDCHDVLWDIRDIAIQNHKIESASYSVSKKMSFIEAMLLTHNEAKGNKIDDLDLATLCNKHEKLEAWIKGTITEKRLKEVSEMLPCKPRQEWPRHVHKEIAKKLNISNTKVAQCIDELKSRGSC